MQLTLIHRITRSRGNSDQRCKGVPGLYVRDRARYEPYSKVDRTQSLISTVLFQKTLASSREHIPRKRGNFDALSAAVVTGTKCRLDMGRMETAGSKSNMARARNAAVRIGIIGSKQVLSAISTFHLHRAQLEATNPGEGHGRSSEMNFYKRGHLLLQIYRA